jgi:hypothetical protein
MADTNSRYGNNPEATHTLPVLYNRITCIYPVCSDYNFGPDITCTRKSAILLIHSIE